MQTIVELPEFLRKSEKLLKNSERLDIVKYLAQHPEAGDLLKGTGGIRKLRWSAQNKGKSGGVRVIYYFQNESIPLFLLTVFGKSEKSNLSKGERNKLAVFVSLLVGSFGGTDE